MASSWTDERIEKLKVLWKEGLSASQCADRIGGITRNSVLSKVHRMGLADRGTTVRLSRPKRARKPSGPKPDSQRPRMSRSTSAVQEIFKAQPFVDVTEELVIPVTERKSVATLGEKDCRWPIGDPQHPEFHFCGKVKAKGLPYCDHHVRRAYQPPEARMRRPATQAAAGGLRPSQPAHGTPDAATAPARNLEVVK